METQEDNNAGGNGCGDGGGYVGSSSGSPAAETSSLRAKTSGGMIDVNCCVPPFLIKLYKMVNDKSTDSIISWGSSCTTFIILDERRLISEILPCYFKTNRFDSFMSQLNNYGFKKKGYERVEFQHDHFQKGKQHLLKNIKTKRQQSKVVKHTSPFCIPTSELEIAYANVKMRQKQINKKIQQVKDDIENSFNEVQNNLNDMTNKLLFTFSEKIGHKRKFIDIDHRIDFDDIEKHFESVYGQCDVSDGYDVEGLMVLSESSGKGTTTLSDRGGGDRSLVPPFLHKLYHMVEKKDIDHLISWNVPRRDSFIISDINKFASHVLPMYFSHAHFSSFNSQLNTYGFKKVSWERHEYANEWFTGGRYDLLVNIKRRDKKLQFMGSAKTYSSTQIDMFRNRLKTIQQDQDSKIIWLSNYEEKMKVSVDEFKETVDNMANIVNEMILKSNEKLDYDKKMKLDIEDSIIGNQKGKDLVDELRNEESESGHNTSVDVQSFLREQEIHLNELDQTMEMEMQDPFIVEKVMDDYLHICRGDFK